MGDRPGGGDGVSGQIARDRSARVYDRAARAWATAASMKGVFASV